MDFAAKPTGKAKEKYWMQQLRSVLPRRFNYGKLDEFKSNNLHINVTRKFVPLPNIVLKLSCYLWRNHKGILHISPKIILHDLNDLMNTNVFGKNIIVLLIVGKTTKAFLVFYNNF